MIEDGGAVQQKDAKKQRAHKFFFQNRIQLSDFCKFY